MGRMRSVRQSSACFECCRDSCFGLIVRHADVDVPGREMGDRADDRASGTGESGQGYRTSWKDTNVRYPYPPVR